MSKARKTWREKMADSKDLPKVFTIEDRHQKRLGQGTCVIAPPREVEALMRRVPSGKLVTINELRTALARHHGTDTACPITTGIFAWMAAYAAEETAELGGANPTPYWRTLKKDGEVNAKYPGGAEAIVARLQAEGHTVRQRGKRWFVEGYDKNLVTEARLSQS
jgi:hypothetical protein